MEIGAIPWVLALVTAAWFGWMAYRADRNATLWVVGGAAFGLVISTIVLGLGQASTIPFSDQQRTAEQIKWTTAAILIIAVGGWALSSGLHRHHLKLWQKIRPGAETAPANPPPKPPGAPAPKQVTAPR